MKTSKRILYVLSIVVTTFLTGCQMPQENHFDETLLYGKWIEGTLHETYLEDGGGYTWDTSEDITEEEATYFTWTLNNDQLLVEHLLWDSTIVPKIYTVTELTSTELAYHDSYGNEHNFIRIFIEPCEKH